MQIEFNILEKSLETELTHQSRTIPLLKGIIISFIIIFILPKSDTAEFFMIRIGFVFLSIIYYLIYYAGESGKSDVQDYFIGKLTCYPDRFILEKGEEQIIISEHFRRQLIFRYEGYHEEVIGGYHRNSNIYYGTNNTIIIRDTVGEKTFYILLKDKHNQKQFFELIDWVNSKKLIFKEFTRGERTYLGKKLTFKEVQDFKNNA